MADGPNLRGIRRYSWEIRLGLALLAVSAACFATQVLIFGRAAETLSNVLQMLGVVFIELLLVVVVIDQLLRRHERHAAAHKMNMVIGAFFNETGLTLLRYLARFDAHQSQIREITRLGDRWTTRDFTRVRRELESYDYTIDCHCADLAELRDLLVSERQFFVNLLANPSLLEHESFADLLWAISHVAQELIHRDDLEHLSEPDERHIEEDMRRVYILLTYQWLLYVWHLQHTHPYIYDYFRRRSPFADE
jgi:hypothetical protein